MTTLVLVRHGLTHLTGPVLAGWTPGLHLDDRGRKQAEQVAARLRPLAFDALVTSPLDRCLDTIAAIAEGRDEQVTAAQVTAAQVTVDDRIGECRYGDWTGRPIAELVKEPLWKVVQQHPSAAVFPGPGGESLRETQNRALAAVREWNARLGPDATWLACSHADVIKAIVADAMGLHLDLFQRIVIDPCSVTVIRYTQTRPFVVRVNDTGGGVDDLLPALVSNEGKDGSDHEPDDTPDESDAAVGGGAGAAAGLTGPAAN